MLGNKNFGVKNMLNKNKFKKYFVSKLKANKLFLGLF